MKSARKLIKCYFNPPNDLRLPNSDLDLEHYFYKENIRLLWNSDTSTKALDDPISAYKSSPNCTASCMAWDQWKNKTPLEFIDPSITNSTPAVEIMRFINIGLLCVQKEVDARPSMATVVSLINNYSIALPLPQEPPFFVCKSSKGTSENRCSTESMVSVNTTPITQMHPR
ncbi:cysteine-rich receptor-like protein kinase 10 [Artemisia annua]|uniref:Cysteine-rich receptor-like protein kinase 10 n=1 Tax=Artemisia annua TaxID=35608 RepID=A0A2U1LGX9_ARTAN|nr:cysteine-rich receptor-like protein kinase 10 [Artemisia annua]